MRVGVVGTGYLGRLHARVLTEIPEAKVTGFVERNDEVAAEIQSGLSLKRVGSVAELARQVDCAVIATPTISHFEVARELIEAGCDVLIEKPITATIDEAKKLIDLADRRKKLIQVGHVERYNPAIVAAADHLTDVRYFEAERLGVFVGRSLDIDVLLDLMIHDLNLVLSLLSKKVVEIRALGVPVLTDKVDIANVRLELENGAVANLTASRVSHERVRKQRFFASDSYISVDSKDQEVKGYRLREKAIQPLEIVVKKKEPLRAELEAFLQCVRDRKQPLVSGIDGLEAVDLATRVAEELEKSMRRRGAR